jgi:hypothetical protein
MKEKKGGERKDAKHTPNELCVAHLWWRWQRIKEAHLHLLWPNHVYWHSLWEITKPWLLLLSVHTRLSLKLLVSCCCEWQMRQDWLLCTKFNAGLGQIDFSLCGDQRDCDCFCGVWVPTFFFCAILVSMFRNGPSHFIPCVIWDPFSFKILPSS